MGMVSNLKPSGAGLPMGIGMLSALLPYEKKVHFVDAARTKVEVAVFWGSKMMWSTFITQFPDDAPPITISPVTSVENAESYSGRLCTWDLIDRCQVSLSVIPNSEDEMNLAWLATNQSILMRGGFYMPETGFGDDYGAMVESKFGISLVIYQDKVTRMNWLPLGPLGNETKRMVTNFKKGRIYTYPGGAALYSMRSTGHSVSQEGRNTSNTFVFEFSDWSTTEEKAEEASFRNVAKTIGVAAARTLL